MIEIEKLQRKLMLKDLEKKKDLNIKNQFLKYLINMSSMKNSLISVLLLSSSILLAQSKKSDLIGYWHNIDNASIYYVFVQNKVVDISIYNNGKISGSFYTYGFSNELKLKNVNDLQEEGMFYYEVNEDDFEEENKEIDGTYAGIQANVIQMDDDKNGFQIYDPLRPGQRGVYKRINKLPLKIEEYLESRNIIIDQLINYKVIKIGKSIIHSAHNQPTKMYLIKGDEVECLEEMDGWYKIRFYGKKTIEGWIRKSDVE